MIGWVVFVIGWILSVIMIGLIPMARFRGLLDHSNEPFRDAVLREMIIHPMCVWRLLRTLTERVVCWVHDRAVGFLKCSSALQPPGLRFLMYFLLLSWSIFSSVSAESVVELSFIYKD
jgi:hypothetical protein